jgi:dihydropteroate synthase
MVEEGAALIDVGGESTRPGAERISAAEQIRRVLPVIASLARRRVPVTISIDTTQSDVAKAALDAGAALINDISAAREDPAMLPLAAQRKVPVILMHMKGTPATMQIAPTYDDVMSEVRETLRERLSFAMSSGIEINQLLIDPGIGFGKTLEHNLSLLSQLSALRELGRPMVVGTSRKKFIGTITGEPEASNRVFGTAASVAWCVAQGASIVRVHDVKPMRQVVQMIDAIMQRPSR